MSIEEVQGILLAKASPRQSWKNWETLSRLPYRFQRQLVSVNRQNIIIFASCYDLVASTTETASSCSSPSETLRFNRVYVTDLLSLH